MGTETRYFNLGDIVTEQELRARWSKMQDDDEHERGHDPYNGALTHADLRVSNKVFKTHRDASDFAHDADVGKGDAVAYKYGDKPGFPRTKADNELVERIACMQKEIDSFHVDIVKRFVDSKSSSKKCVHCDSVISKKSRQHIARSHGKASSVMDRHMFGEITDCPACGGNLLVTDTDKKRLESVTKRHREAVAKKHEALAAAKKTSSAWGFVIVAATPS